MKMLYRARFRSTNLSVRTTSVSHTTHEIPDSTRNCQEKKTKETKTEAEQRKNQMPQSTKLKCSKQPQFYRKSFGGRPFRSREDETSGSVVVFRPQTPLRQKRPCKTSEKKTRCRDNGEKERKENRFTFHFMRKDQNHEETWSQIFTRAVHEFSAGVRQL